MSNFRVFYRFYFAILLFWVGLPMGIQAQEVNKKYIQELNTINTQELSKTVGELKQISTNASPLLAQAETVKITEVKVNSWAQGIEIVVESTAGVSLKPVTRTQGKVSYTDIPNAILSLGDRQEFKVENPTKGIANISVTQISPTFVRVLITGKESLPNAQVAINEKGLIITSTLAITAQKEDDEEDIVVKGDRRRVPSIGSKTDVPIRDIPASIQIIPADVIKNSGATNLDQAIRSAPSVQRTGGGSYGFGNTYLIRGLSQSFLRDGVPDSSSINGYFRTLIDVDNIEIIKGPGSSLYGSLNPGGTINLVSKRPLSEPAYGVNLTFGSLGTYGGSLDFTGALNDDKSLLYRFIGSYQSTDGFRGLSNRGLELLPKITWKPNEFNTINFSFDYRRAEIVADTYGIPFRGTQLLDVPRESRYYTPFATTRQNVYRGAINHEWQVNPDLLVRNNFVLLYRDLTLARNASGGAFVGFSNTPADRILRDQTDNAFDFTYQTEAVLKAITGDVKHTLLAGVEYQYKNYTATRDTLVFKPIKDIFNPILEQSRNERTSLLRSFDIRYQANYLGLYLQDQVDFSEQLKARVGARLDVLGLGRTGFANTLNAASTAIISTQTADLAQSPTRFSYQAGLVYQPIRELSIYGGISKNNLAVLSTEGVADQLDPPESALQYELGLKTELFDGRLALNLALFDITRENFIVTLNSIRQPVGAQKTRGIELEFNAKPVDGWNLYGGLVFYDAKLTNLPNAPQFEGNRPTGVPNAAASLWTSYEFQTGDLKGLGLGGGLTYRDTIFQDQDNLRIIPAYTTFDLVLFYRQKTFEAQLNFYNITNASYFTNGVNTGALQGNPFTVTASLGFKF